MELLLVSVLLGFLTALLGGPYARKFLLDSGIYGIDQQKEGKPKVATSGGLLVLFGFIVATTSFLGFTQFLSGTSVNVSLILASLSSVTIIALIGLVDDIHIRKESIETGETPTEKLWNKLTGKLGDGIEEEHESIDREGIGQLPKMLFVLPAAFPLIAVGAGSWSMTFPLLGQVNWGIVYPLVLLPLGLMFVSNVVNMLAGTNGLSAGLSAVTGAGLGLFALMNGETEAALIALGLAASMTGFLRYNWYPASLLPGDSLTYLSGAALFSAMVIGNMEKFGVFIFAPYFLEFFLKLRSGFNAHSWGKLENGKLVPQHQKNYSLTHLPMRRGMSEKQVTVSIILLQVAVVLLGLLLFSTGVL